MLLEARDSLLLVIDVQERLAPAVSESERVVQRIALVMKAAGRLGLPLVVTEHCSQGIGHTLPALAALAPKDAVFEKINFACAREPAILERIGDLDRRQIVIVGLEAHVCVLQSALVLLERDYEVFLVADAVASRRESDREVALARVERAGGTIITSEMALFEWLARGDHPAAKELLALIKET